MGDTKKAIKQEIKAIYKNVLNDLTEEEQQLTSQEKVELREHIEELPEGQISSFVPTFIRKKIRDIIRNRNGEEKDDRGEIGSLVDDDIPNQTSYGSLGPSDLQMWNDRVIQETGDPHTDKSDKGDYRLGFITALLYCGKINKEVYDDLQCVFAPESNYYVEDGEVKNAEQ